MEVPPLTWPFAKLTWWLDFFLVSFLLQSWQLKKVFSGLPKSSTPPHPYDICLILLTRSTGGNKKSTTAHLHHVAPHRNQLLVSWWSWHGSVSLVGWVVGWLESWQLIYLVFFWNQDLKETASKYSDQTTPQLFHEAGLRVKLTFTRWSLC